MLLRRCWEGLAATASRQSAVVRSPGNQKLHRLLQKPDETAALLVATVAELAEASRSWMKFVGKASWQRAIVLALVGVNRSVSVIG